MWKVVSYFNTPKICIVDEDSKILSAAMAETFKTKLQKVVDAYNEIEIEGTDSSLSGDLFSNSFKE